MTIRLTRHKLLTTTAALSVALGSMAPLPMTAQESPATTTAPPVVVPPTDVPEVVPPEAEAPADTTPPAVETPAPQDTAPQPPAEAPSETLTPAPEPEATEEEPAAPAPAQEEEPAPDAPAPEPQAPTAAEPEQPAPSTEPTAPATNESAAPIAPDVQPPAEQESAPVETTPPPAPATTTDAEPQATTQPTEQAVDVLNSLLGGTAAGTAAGAAAGAEATSAPDSEAAESTTTQITEDDARTSSEDFTTSASGEQRSESRDRRGLSDLQKAGLLALGGLTVGALLSNGNEVVSNTGDRVVVRQNDGNYTVLKDDDALLRQPGSTVRTENFTDGSTRSTVEYADGSRVVTVRDASGRVLRRERIDPVGQQVRLFDDTAQVAPVDTSVLPRARDDVRVSATDRTALRDALARIEARDNARAYSLSQIRDYRQVRALAPVVDVDNITFRSGSAAVDASQARQLSDLGNLMRDMIADKPTEVFLIEGHTDATGSASSNLALSDRRAESVALALTEYFDVPPENLVVQGYGESDLRVDTQADEPRNRRVAVRIITPLLQTAQSR